MVSDARSGGGAREPTIGWGADRGTLVVELRRTHIPRPGNQGQVEERSLHP